MRRKIVMNGPSSLTVSLPSKWIKDNGLQKGDEIDIVESEAGLIIKTIDKSCDVKKIEVSFNSLDKETKKEVLLTLHKKGYDEIKITYDNDSVVKEIYSLLNALHLGFEIVTQNTNDLTLKNVSNPESDQFDNLFRRVFRITLEYASKIEAIVEKKENITESCLLHETSIKRISNCCKRIVVKENKPNAPFMLSLLESLEVISQSLSQLLEEVKSNSNKIDSKELHKSYQDLTVLLGDVYHLYYKFSQEEFSSIKSKSQKLKLKLKKLKTDEPKKSCCIDALSLINEKIATILNQILAIQF